MDRLEDFRQVFAAVVAARGDCENPRIREAFARVPRHEFIGAAPWHFTEHGADAGSDDPALLYQDVAMGLARERGIPTGLPSLHARALDACDIRPGERVVHVGAGAGYYTAILAELVGERGQVLAYELDAPLAGRAAQQLRAWPWAKVEHASGTTAPLTGIDLMYVCAAVEQIPPGWLGSLRRGGRLLFPLVPHEEEGGVLLVRHLGSESVLSARFVCPARFVPCIGAEDDAGARARLVAAFRSGTRQQVRTLRRAPEAPDESAWYVGQGWWLSTRQAEAV
jgi:protein-L-isoaspartate(D-aspartate) O-methyltransferase